VSTEEEVDGIEDGVRPSGNMRLVDTVAMEIISQDGNEDVSSESSFVL
jgi:hypothetical protein